MEASAGVPYSVSERNFTVECFQPQGENLYAVFFTHARETIDYHYERNVSDPRVTHTVVLQADPFGDVLQSISVAYGRNLSSSGVALAAANAWRRSGFDQRPLDTRTARASHGAFDIHSKHLHSAHRYPQRLSHPDAFGGLHVATHSPGPAR